MRVFLAMAFLCLSSLPLMAADNGGFGASFNNKPPSALMESPNSQVAQSVQTPTADDLQNIMPAAGDEADIKSEGNMKTPSTPDAKTDAAPSLVETAK